MPTNPSTDEIWRICPPPRALMWRAAFWVKSMRAIRLTSTIWRIAVGVLVGELGVVAEPGVVDQQVDAARQRLGPLPEPVAEAGVGQVAGHRQDPPRRTLGGQGLEPVEPAGRGQHGHPPVADELADQLPSQARGRAGDEGVAAS